MELTPHKATPVEVTDSVDVCTLAQAALLSCCDQVRLNTPGAQQGEDPAFAHQLRVGARRLRVALRLFRKLLDANEVSWLEGELKWAFSRLGAQRELDVLLRDTIATLRERAETPALLELQKTIEAERDKRRSAVQDALASKRYAKLLQAVVALPGLVDADEHSARKWARKKLRHRSEQTLAHYESALSGDPHQRHQLRKQFKKLRYASELNAPLFKHKRVKRYLSALEDVQEALGALNDVAAGRNELTLLSSGRHVELGSALATCEDELARREAEQLAKLEPLLKAHAEAEPFWL